MRIMSLRFCKIRITFAIKKSAFVVEENVAIRIFNVKITKKNVVLEIFDNKIAITQSLTRSKAWTKVKLYAISFEVSSMLCEELLKIL